jgi:ribosomal protein S19E (S16A)
LPCQSCKVPQSINETNIIPYTNRRGSAPERHQDAAGGIIRTILITLDDLKITEKTEKGGRRISRIGQQALDLVAGQVARGEV